jgi:hypothetical protein
MYAPPLSDFVATCVVRHDAMLVVPQANDVLPSPKQSWKSMIAFGLLGTGLIATILWCAFLFTLFGQLAWSFF